MKKKAFLTRRHRVTRHKRVRAKVLGTADRPRLSVFRSSAHIWAQLVDDTTGSTLVAASDKELKAKTKTTKTTKTERAVMVGELLAKKAKEKKIMKVVFDRGGFQYHGRITALADAARKGGLTF